MRDQVRVAIILLSILFGVCSANVSSSIITAGCGNVNVSCTLAELTGGASISIDQVVFDGWNVEDFSSQAVNINNVVVSALDDQPSNVGLAFATNGSIGTADLDLVELLINFAVTAQSGSRLISNASFELTDFSFGVANSGGFIEGSEDLFDMSGGLIGNNFVVADNFSPSFFDLFGSLDFSPLPTLSVEKLLLISGDEAGDEVVLNEFVHRFGFVTVPEPATSLLLISGFLSLAWKRRKKGYPFVPI